MFSLPSIEASGMTFAYIFNIIITLLGGLGLFLYGIKSTGDNLKALAGSKLKMIIEKTTNTPLKGVLVGILVTIILQSSSGTDALVISLVGAGLMGLEQAIGVILGANIGTTLTSFIIGLKIQKYALIFIGIGAIMVFFMKKKKRVNLGKVVLGIGFLFFGLDLMSTGIEAITNEFSSQTEKFFSVISKTPILGYFVGTIFTIGIQSSGATIAIVQSLYANGAIQSLKGAITLMLGANLGTTITAVIASIGSGKEAKQVAFVSVLHKLVWTIIFMCFIVPYTYLIKLLENNVLSKIAGPNINDYGMMTIALSHMIFNIISVIIMLFFVKHISTIVNKIFNSKSNSKKDLLISNLSDYTLVRKSPALATEFVKKCIDYMGSEVLEFFIMTHDYVFNYNDLTFEKGMKLEQNIDLLNKKIHDYLIKITRENNIDKDTTNTISKYLDTIVNLERIGDHCTNLMEFAKETHDLKISYSKKGKEELEQMFSVIEEMVKLSREALISEQKEKALIVLEKEEKVDLMEKEFRRHHFVRINEGKCVHVLGDNFVDMLSNLERIGDHCDNIANCVILKDYSLSA